MEAQVHRVFAVRLPWKGTRVARCDKEPEAYEGRAPQQSNRHAQPTLV